MSKNLHSISMMEVSRDKVPEVIKLFVNIVDGEVSESFIDECLNFGDDTYTFTYGDGYRIYVSEETDDLLFCDDERFRKWVLDFRLGYLCILYSILNKFELIFS